MTYQTGDALLPPMEQEDFRHTEVYEALRVRKEYLAEISRFLCAGLDSLDFVANPRQGYYTQYDQEDFDEVLCYLEQQESADHGKPFSMVETPVGKFVICRNNSGAVLGILSKK